MSPGFRKPASVFERGHTTSPNSRLRPAPPAPCPGETATMRFRLWTPTTPSRPHPSFRECVHVTTSQEFELQPCALLSPPAPAHRPAREAPSLSAPQDVPEVLDDLVSPGHLGELRRDLGDGVGVLESEVGELAHRGYELRGPVVMADAVAGHTEKRCFDYGSVGWLFELVGARSCISLARPGVAG